MFKFLHRILVVGILYKAIDLLIGNQMREQHKRETEKSSIIVKHFQKYKIIEVFGGLSENVQFKTEDGSWYVFKPMAMRKPNETKWIRLWEEK